MHTQIVWYDPARSAKSHQGCACRSRLSGKWEGRMIDWQTASWIAGVAANAVSSIDKLYRGYADFFNKKQPTVGAPPPDIRIQNNVGEQALVATSVTTGAVSQKVTYDDLRAKLTASDRAYIEALSQSLDNYEKQWNSALVAKSMASGMDVGRYDAQLAYL